MPYIPQGRRKMLETALLELSGRLANASAGTMNYVISRLIDIRYGKKDYEEYNSALGVLEAVKQEYYRRRVARYEDRKIQENGDIFLL